MSAWDNCHSTYLRHQNIRWMLTHTNAHVLQADAPGSRIHMHGEEYAIQRLRHGSETRKDDLMHTKSDGAGSHTDTRRALDAQKGRQAADVPASEGSGKSDASGGYRHAGKQSSRHILQLDREMQSGGDREMQSSGAAAHAVGVQQDVLGRRQQMSHSKRDDSDVSKRDDSDVSGGARHEAGGQGTQPHDSMIRRNQASTRPNVDGTKQWEESASVHEVHVRSRDAIQREERAAADLQERLQEAARDELLCQVPAVMCLAEDMLIRMPCMHVHWR